MTTNTLDWYLRQCPEATWANDVDPRCWTTLKCLGTGLHNLILDDFPGGGLRLYGNHGLAILLRMDLATWDMDELTNLVIDAHAQAVRVNLSAKLIHGLEANPFDFESGWQAINRGAPDDGGFPWTDDARQGGCETCERLVIRADAWSPWAHDGETDPEFWDWHNTRHTPVPAIGKWRPMAMLEVQISPREPLAPGVSSMVGHPTLADLAKRCVGSSDGRAWCDPVLPS